MPKLNYVKRFCSILILFSLLSVLAGAQTDAGSYFREGYQLYMNGQFDEAIKSYNLAVGLEPQKGYYYYHRANAFFARGSKEQALNDYLKANEIKATPEIHYQIGVILYERKESEEALSNFEQVKISRDNYEKLNFYLGVLYYKADRYTEALTCLTKYTATVKNHGDAFYFSALCNTKLSKYKEAIQCLNQSQLYNTSDWSIYYKYYELYTFIGNKEKALYNISMVIELGQTKAIYYTIRSQLYDTLGYKEKAKEDREFASSTSINNVQK